MMSSTPLKIPEVILITPQRLHDERGFLSETYSKKRLLELGIDAEFVQDNHSFSKAGGVVRGLHFQIEPHAQAKLVRVARGAIFDVAVDIRRGSPSFGKHVSAILSADNWHQLWIPVGFAHGFCTLESNTEVLYKATGYYSSECGRGIKWDDPALGIQWPVEPDQAILSEQDRKNPPLAELVAAF
ncbi:MAG: dTDP-4-dehydrorhamnose 3,5-epimerase [Hyphomicrobiales bacterium]